MSAGISDNFVSLRDQADAEVKNKNKVGFYTFRGARSKKRFFSCFLCGDI